MSFPYNPDDPYGIEGLRPKDDRASWRARSRDRTMTEDDDLDYRSPATGSVDVEVEPHGDRGHEGDGTVGVAAGSAAGSAPEETTAAPAGVRKARRKRSARRNLIEWGIVIVGAVVVAFLIKTFLVQAFYIPTSSMAPTLAVDDRVLVNKLSYQLHDVNRGDIVVFERPDNAPRGDVNDLIKRVIALPGEFVEVRDGAVFIDGEKLEEPYLEEGTRTPDFTASMPGCVAGSRDGCLIPNGHVFVLGDNRDNSQASNVFGPIDEDLIIGRAFIRVWPVSNFGGL